jgi:pimeloyl-ACP methyl ester carboxylesterase
MVPPDVSVIYVGHSMGAAAGVLAAARDLRIRGLVSLAGMTHTAAFAKREFAEVTPDEGFIWEDENFPLSRTLVDDLVGLENTLSAAEAVTQPWLLVHGTLDDVIPIQDGRDAFEAATCEKEWLEIAGAGHSFDEASYPQIVAAVNQWLRANFG